MSKGTLYIVSTPIGNLGDISQRAEKTLKEADYIAAEDTRHTLKLLNNLGIKNALISFFEHSSKEKALGIINLLLEGKDVALVSDAGTPVISDPGAPVIELCYKNDIPVTAVPGPCAAISALVLSGISAEKFTFEGFLPKEKPKRREAILNALKNPYTTVIYESPHAIKDTLLKIAEIAPERQAAVVKELTKIHERVYKDTAKNLSELFSREENIRGEFIIVLAGKEENTPEATDEMIVLELKTLIKKGMSSKNAIKEVALKLEAPKNRVYKLYTECVL